MRALGIVVALLSGVLVLASCASDDAPKHRKWNPNAGPTRNEDWHSPTSMMAHYDANHDGSVTRKELEDGLHAEFNALDKKHTGCLDADEVTAINEERMKSDESAASPLIDWKNKGCIDFDEYATMARSLFDDMDKNADGVLSPKELHPHKERKNNTPPPESPIGTY